MLIWIPLMVVSGCEEDGLPYDLVSFEFRLLDEDGNSSTEFEEDVNFIFSFEIINKSDHEIFFDHSSMSTEEVFKVYRIGNSLEETGLISMGRPYNGIFCEYTTGSFISPNDTLRLKIPWKPASDWTTDAPYFSPYFCDVNHDNKLLQKGNYQTGFSSSFRFSIDETIFNTPDETFKISFTIN